MEISRRTAVKSSLALFAVLGTGALSACSTAAGGPKGAAGAKALNMWIWPDGMSDTVIAGQPAKFPGTPVKASVIGGDFKQKLTTTFVGKTGLPDITGIKGEDMPYFLSQPDLFVDLNTLGAKDIQAEYLDWKWASGATPDGKVIGLPIDIGPTALYYRHDIFEECNMPSTPEAVAEYTGSWDKFFELGLMLKEAKPGAFLIRNMGTVYSIAIAQGKENYINEKNEFIGDQAHIRNAWDLAVKALDLGIVARIASNTTDVAAAVVKGLLPADVGAAWHLADLQGDAPTTSGKWRVTDTPGGAANQGGSFLSIPAGTENPAESWESIKWMLDPANQAVGYADKGLFPSTPASYDMEQLTGGVEFLGGQKAIEVFGRSAKAVPVQYFSQHSGTVAGPFDRELTNIEANGKDPEAAWQDAVRDAKKLCAQLGVSSK